MAASSATAASTRRRWVQRGRRPGETWPTCDEISFSRRLKLVASQVSHVSPSRRPRWSHRRRVEAAVALLAGMPALDALVAEEIAFEDAARELPRILGPGGPGLAPVIRYPKA